MRPRLRAVISGRYPQLVAFEQENLIYALVADLEIVQYILVRRMPASTPTERERNLQRVIKIVTSPSLLSLRIRCPEDPYIWRKAPSQNISELAPAVGTVWQSTQHISPTLSTSK